MLEPLQRLVERAEWRLRLARAVREGAGALTWTLTVMAVAALVIEVGWGLTLRAVTLLLVALALPLGAAARALVSAQGPVRAAKALDRGAGLFDRIGTALAFARARGGLVERQRSDALERAAGVSAAGAIPLGLGRAVRGPLVASLLWAALVAVGLLFDLHPDPPAPEPTALERVGEDLLASLADIEDDAVATGNKQLELRVTDLRDRVRAIVEQEKERRHEPRPEPEPEEEEAEPPPPADEPPPPPDGVYTVAELEALHDQLQLELYAATDFDLDSVRRQASSALRANRDPMRQIAPHERATQDLNPNHTPMEREQMGSSGHDRVFGDRHYAFNSGIDSARSMAGMEGQLNEIRDSKRNMLDGETMVADEKRVAMEQLFNQFLEEFVAERGQQVADWMAGKRDPRHKVNTSAGEQVEDKTDAMAEAGFEDVSDDPYSGLKDPGTPSGPLQQTDRIPEGAERIDGAPPADGSPRGGASLTDGEPETTLGAQGAGRGNPADGEGAAGDGIGRSGAQQLERILGQVTDDRMPPEKRREVLEEIASRKIRGGFANDFDDEQRNYFEEADRILIEEGEDLPPLFRDYAHTYFEALLGL